MIELIIQLDGEGPYLKDMMEMLRHKGAQYPRIFYKGDIVKCVNKNWYKAFDLPTNWGVLRVRSMNWAHDRSILTEPLMGGTESRTVIGRRRHYIDVGAIKAFKKKRVVTVWSLKGIIKDKEDGYAGDGEAERIETYGRRRPK